MEADGVTGTAGVLWHHQADYEQYCLDVYGDTWEGRHEHGRHLHAYIDTVGARAQSAALQNDLESLQSEVALWHSACRARDEGIQDGSISGSSDHEPGWHSNVATWLSFSCQSGAMATVRYLVSEFPQELARTCVLRKMLGSAASGGDLDMMRWLLQEAIPGAGCRLCLPRCQCMLFGRNRDSWQADVFSKARDDIETVRWVVAMVAEGDVALIGCEVLRRKLTQACRLDLALARYLFELYLAWYPAGGDADYQFWPGMMWSVACEGGRAEIAAWLFADVFPRLGFVLQPEDVDRGFHDACRAGAVPLAQWLYSDTCLGNLRVRFTDTWLQTAIHLCEEDRFPRPSIADLRMVQWLLRTATELGHAEAVGGILTAFMWRLFVVACQIGDDATVRWLYSLGMMNMTTFLHGFAASTRQLSCRLDLASGRSVCIPMHGDASCPIIDGSVVHTTGPGSILLWLQAALQLRFLGPSYDVDVYVVRPDDLRDLQCNWKRDGGVSAVIPHDQGGMRCGHIGAMEHCCLLTAVKYGLDVCGVIRWSGLRVQWCTAVAMYEKRHAAFDVS